MVERNQPTVKITKELLQYEVGGTFLNPYGGHEFTGTNITVTAGEQVLWSKDVLPYFGGLVIPVPKPFYATRLKMADRKAVKIASAFEGKTSK